MHPEPPKLRHSLSELARAGGELVECVLEAPRLGRAAPRGDGHPVIALPGYGGGDASLAILRAFLRRVGYAPHALGLGVNFETRESRIRRIEDALRFRSRMVDRVVARIDQIVDEAGQRVSLVGWSMGGLYAFDAARARPESVRGVVTLGSPFGDPRGTSLFNLMRFLSRSDVPIEDQDFAAWEAERDKGAAGVPVRILYSPTDGIVAPEIARIPAGPDVECIEVDSSHLGFGINKRALERVAEQLAGL